MKCNVMKCNVCMYVCNVCMYVCIYVCMYVGMYVGINVMLCNVMFCFVL